MFHPALSGQIKQWLGIKTTTQKMATKWADIRHYKPPVQTQPTARCLDHIIFDISLRERSMLVKLCANSALFRWLYLASVFGT